VLAVTAIFNVPAFQDRFLRDYQRDRIERTQGVRDVRGSDYQTWRAEIAFGVGGVTGEGFLRGEQKRGRFIPEQHNDFILTVLGEEGGLVGTSILVCCFAVFFYRIFLIMFQATEFFYRLVATGIFAVLAFHTVVNTFMVVQLLPVVGLWLPFMSHGGTALWLCLACLGLLLNIRSRERPILFQ
jgi:rod shape determining protein RodA